MRGNLCKVGGILPFDSCHQNMCPQKIFPYSLFWWQLLKMSHLHNFVLLNVTQTWLVTLPQSVQIKKKMTIHILYFYNVLLFLFFKSTLASPHMSLPQQGQNDCSPISNAHTPSWMKSSSCARGLLDYWRWTAIRAKWTVVSLFSVVLGKRSLGCHGSTIKRLKFIFTGKNTHVFAEKKKKG